MVSCWEEMCGAHKSTYAGLKGTVLHTLRPLCSDVCVCACGCHVRVCFWIKQRHLIHLFSSLLEFSIVGTKNKVQSMLGDLVTSWLRQWLPYRGIMGSNQHDSRVLQGRRAGPIIQTSMDRSHPLLKHVFLS